MASEALVSRLEAVTARLERLARKQGGGGGDDDDEVRQEVTDFEAIVNTQVAALVKAAGGCGAKAIVDHLNNSWGNLLNLIKGTSACKKPSPADLMKFLQPAVDVIAAADKLKFKRGKMENHYAAFYELCVMLSWVTMAPPYGLPLEHCKAQTDSAQFHLNRILKKTKEDKKKAEHKAFVDAVKGLCAACTGYVKEYYKTGLSWVGKGDINSFVPGQKAPAASATASAPAEQKEEKSNAAPAKKKKAGGGGGKAGLFAELAKKADGGDSAAKGMKKVSRAVRKAKPKSSKVVMKVKKAKVKNKKPPSTQNRGGSWMIENYNEGVNELPEKITMKQNAYIASCNNCAMVLKQKIKGMTIDSCQKVKVYVNEIVSVIEMINCKSVTIFVQGRVPSIQIDKCSSPRIVIMRPAMNPFPQIITSNISAGNVEYAGKTDDDDFIEIPLPEQFENKIDLEKGSITAVQMSHG